ncbi:obscurin-like [Macrosteles quadrilineatus]|uniref:obscurin-like n=1 Tax=Macrosteles quadrilineatus TaxID=74068 RepID=UPI0023E2FD0A|nr:obscurin-like [Macrosteles quadrilineatus]
MLWWVFVMAVLGELSCNSQSGHDDTNIESLLQMLFYESTFSPAPAVSTTPRVLPYFETTSLSTNLTAQLGDPVVFHCKVNDLVDDASVSWLRRQDGQLLLLSVGVEVYSKDTRIAAHLTPPNDWQLRLAAAQQGDQGGYECQVSSHPPIVQTVHLHVIVPELVIADERGLPIRNKFYNAGSTIELKCIISRVPHPSSAITWRHGTRTISSDTSRRGISVKTEEDAEGATSRLFIANARTVDSGDYSCSLGSLVSTSVAVHVLNGETPAAMQHGGGSVAFPCHCFYLLLIIINLLSSR